MKRTIALLCLCCALDGCQHPLPAPAAGGWIRGPGGMEIHQPQDAQSPATLTISSQDNHTGSSETAATPVEGVAASYPTWQAIPGGLILTASTGISQPSTAAQIGLAQVAADSRSPLMYAGIGLIVIGLLVATLAHYPTPGGLLALCGVALIGLHTYPWLGLISAALGAAAAGIYTGHEIGERKAKSATSISTP